MQTKNLYFLGDIHAEFEWLKLEISRKKVNDATIIQVGDFGLGFRKDESLQLSSLNVLCRTNNIQLHVIRGNHDDPSRFDSGDLYSNLKFLKDYSILKLDGISILLAGGAISIDRLWKMENGTYWGDERFVFSPSRLSQIKKEINTIDIVVTHSAPREVYPYVHDPIVQRYSKYDPALENDLVLDRLEHSKFYEYLKLIDLTPHFWYYGHFHKSNVQVVERTRFQLLGINEIVKHKQ